MKNFLWLLSGLFLALSFLVGGVPVNASTEPPPFATCKVWIFIPEMHPGAILFSIDYDYSIVDGYVFFAEEVNKDQTKERRFECSELQGHFVKNLRVYYAHTLLPGYILSGQLNIIKDQIMLITADTEWVTHTRYKLQVSRGFNTLFLLIFLLIMFIFARKQAKKKLHEKDLS